MSLALSVVMSVAQGQEVSQADAGSQESLVTTVDLKTAINNALQYNKQLQSSEMDRELYYQKVREARSSGLPQVNASLDGTTYFGKEMNFNGKSIKMDNNLKLGATAAWTFSMQIIEGVKIAKIAQRLADTQIASTELDVKANVSDTYYAVLVYERMLEIIKGNLSDMEEIARQTTNSYEAGAVELTDVDQIRVNVATLKNSVLSIERSLETTKKLLVLQMGIPIDTKISTAEKLDDLIANQSIGTLDINNNLQYQTLKASQEINEETIKLRKMAYVPTLTAAYQYTHNFKGGFMSFDHVVTLSLNIPIFSGFQRHSQLKQAQIEAQKTQVNMALLEDNLAQNAEQYQFELNNALDAYNLQKENLEVAQRVLNNYKNKYNYGALSSLSLTQANSNYLQAESSYASACLDLLMAYTKLNKLYNNF